MSTPQEDDPFWWSRPTVLIDQNRLQEAWPSSEMSFERRMNAMVRMAAYSAILLYILGWGDYRVLYLPLLALLLTYAIWYQSTSPGTAEIQDAATESFTGGNKDFARRGIPTADQPVKNANGTFALFPTPDNPFMNPRLGDPPGFQPRQPETAEEAEWLARESERLMAMNLYTDETDMWAVKNASRAFYTVPTRFTDNDWAFLGEVRPTLKEQSLQTGSVIPHWMESQSKGPKDCAFSCNQ